MDLISLLGLFSILVGDNQQFGSFFGPLDRKPLPLPMAVSSFRFPGRCVASSALRRPRCQDGLSFVFRFLFDSRGSLSVRIALWKTGQAFKQI